MIQTAKNLFDINNKELTGKNSGLIPVSLFIVEIMLSVFCAAASAQEADSIFFHLYTDSLKKGTYNYINVDGWHDGHWFPLTEKQLRYSATGGRFERNSLFLDTNFSQEKVVVTVVLKSDTAVTRSVTIYIKKQGEQERLKTKEEILRQPDPRQRKNGNMQNRVTLRQ